MARNASIDKLIRLYGVLPTKKISTKDDQLPPILWNEYAEIYEKTINKILDNISYLDEFYDENKKLYNDITNIAFDKKILIKNNIFKIPGAAIYQIYGQFSEGNDGIPSGGAVASAVPSAYCPQTNFDCYCFTQTHAGNILRATATISSSGLVTITTQGGTAFHYFRIDAIIPQGM